MCLPDLKKSQQLTVSRCPEFAVRVQKSSSGMTNIIRFLVKFDFLMRLVCQMSTNKQPYHSNEIGIACLRGVSKDQSLYEKAEIDCSDA
jgi:hypothetical protein